MFLGKVVLKINRTSFPKNTSGGLLLNEAIYKTVYFLVLVKTDSRKYEKELTGQKVNWLFQGILAYVTLDKYSTTAVFLVNYHHKKSKHLAGISSLGTLLKPRAWITSKQITCPRQLPLLKQLHLEKRQI